MRRMCEFCEIIKTEFGYGFGKDFEDDRPEGHIAFCIRKNLLGHIELHAEAVSHDNEGNEVCEYDGSAKINFCPICGRNMRKEDEGK